MQYIIKRIRELKMNKETKALADWLEKRLNKHLIMDNSQRRELVSLLKDLKGGGNKKIIF